ncbi:MAG: Asp-tRNA(Asn)/Glu-tRNA(Gln) amidotransferase subunit GatC [Akkermansiaceae bacterium]|nr:Asp-tRNA(Asn)/Glu-tRNA(Gln) amidotransferase subunit GatC [Akkermansia sp.]MCD7798213.1 Asp-tRNA(Asn)/Glu-tRNA(Gln) amidotransferase subunit GatC [Akkermansiaceae bacterium]MCD8070063.1 Asp-tRNA(Asn)/Glu-tRNA(Gln) amidotransferase subunit GatC [Akkermansiaceae bacterium]
MTNPLIDVAYIARLARLRLTDDEIARFTQDISQVLEYVNLLNRCDTTDVEPMSHPLPTCDALRADVPGSCLPLSDALMNAPQQAQGRFLVPKVVESA